MQLKRYDSYLQVAEGAGSKKAALMGLALGTMWLFLMFAYGTGMKYGSSLIVGDRRDHPLHCTPYPPFPDDCFTGGEKCFGTAICHSAAF